MLALLATITRAVVHALRRRRPDARRSTRSRGFWGRRVILPSTAYIAAALAVLLTIPLGAARHFYPDTATALTLLTYLCLGWGLLRIPLIFSGPTSRE